jgi:two-component system, LytTR family, response regulator
MLQKIVIIDDEPDAIAVIRGLIDMFCDDVEIVGTALTAVEGIAVIRNEKPDVVLLDIQMPGATGFELLDAFAKRSFKVIFITASSEFAIKALREKAEDYLLKPVNPIELKKALERLRLNTTQSANPQRIAIPDKNGYHYIQPSDIVYIEGDGSYVSLVLKNGEKRIASRNIKTFDEQLSPGGFIRCHQSFLVNPDEVSQLRRTDGVFLVMSNGSEVPVSRAKKEMVLKRLNG